MLIRCRPKPRTTLSREIPTYVVEVSTLNSLLHLITDLDKYQANRYCGAGGREATPSMIYDHRLIVCFCLPLQMIFKRIDESE